MYEFHTNKETYYRWQYENARTHVIPFIESVFPLQPGMQVLEVGCGEGGVLKAFVERGCQGLGVELSESRVADAFRFNAGLVQAGRIDFQAKNIYDASFAETFRNQFHLIILKDVIEHIPDQPRIMEQLKQYLREDGKIFFGFPPWYMPFGGHQQLSRNKILSKLPYYHLLPMPLYKGMLRLFGEQREVIQGLVEVKETGISMERFERICKRLSLRIDLRTIFFLNPIYQYKFGWKPRRQARLLQHVPYLRDFLSTCVYYLIGKN